MLSDKIYDVIELEDMTLREYKDENCAEVEFRSPLDEDVVVTINSLEDESFVKEFRDYAEDFEPDRHAVMWFDDATIPNYGLRDLLDDAEWICSELIRTSQELVKAIG